MASAACRAIADTTLTSPASNRPPARSSVALPHAIPSTHSTARNSSVSPNGSKMSRYRDARSSSPSVTSLRIAAEPC